MLICLTILKLSISEIYYYTLYMLLKILNNEETYYNLISDGFKSMAIH